MIESAQVSAARGYHRAGRRWGAERVSDWVRRRLCLQALLLLLGGFAAAPARAAGDGALITLLDGRATLIIGARSAAAAQGVRLADSTIIDTDAAAKLLRVEWADGRALDLGPATRVMLAPALHGHAPAAFYLLTGWAKVTSPAAATAPGWLAPPLEAAPARGVVVVQVAPAETLLFAETGGLVLIERPGGARRVVESGQFYSAAAGRAGQVSARPNAALLQRMPAAFRDTLPLRREAFKGREVEAVPLPPSSYANLAPWLDAEPALRHDLPRRFAQRLAERDFRTGVSANLRQHPEWAPLLEPPKPKRETR